MGCGASAPFVPDEASFQLDASKSIDGSLTSGGTAVICRCKILSTLVGYDLVCVSQSPSSRLLGADVCLRREACPDVPRPPKDPDPNPDPTPLCSIDVQGLLSF